MQQLPGGGTYQDNYVTDWIEEKPIFILTSYMMWTEMMRKPS